MTESLRLLIEPQATSGAWNMAVDEVLLETALATGRPTLRWYGWGEPTLSLGHFQKGVDPAIGARFAGLPRVRRLSGGGAILHDQEWTYSLALGPDSSWGPHPTRLYRLIHDAVIEVLQEFGMDARLRGVADQTLDHHFLCFSRGDANDVLIGNHKVLGSAQRRRRGAILQHGALFRRASVYAPEFPGFLDLSSATFDEALLRDTMIARTAARLEFDVEAGALDSWELKRSEELLTLKVV